MKAGESMVERCLCHVRRPVGRRASLVLLLLGAAWWCVASPESNGSLVGRPAARAQNPTPILPTPVPIDPPTALPTATSIWGPLDQGRIHLPLALRAALPAPAKRGGTRIANTVLGVSLREEGAWSESPSGPGSWILLEREELPRIRSLGIGTLRLPVRWREIEPSEGRRDWVAVDARLSAVAEAGFEAHVVVVDYPTWATRYRCGGGLEEGGAEAWTDFLSEAAGRWRGRVAIWELGNEPDGESVVEPEDHERAPERGSGEPSTPERGCWGKLAEDYAAFYAAGAEAIHRVAPEATVLPGTFAAETLPLDHDPDFLSAFLGAGGATHADAIAYRWQPQVGDGLVEAERVGRILGNERVDRPLWLTDTGQYTERDSRFLAESYGAQLRFVTRDLLRVAASGRVERLYWHGWRDAPAAEGDEPFAVDPGLVAADGRAKPAWHALAYVLDHAANRPVVVASRLGTEAFRFRGAHEETWLLWSTTGDKGFVSLPLAPGADPATPVDKVLFVPGAEPILPWEEQRRRVPPRDGRVSIVSETDATFVHMAREP